MLRRRRSLFGLKLWATLVVQLELQLDAPVRPTPELARSRSKRPVELTTSSEASPNRLLSGRWHELRLVPPTQHIICTIAIGGIKSGIVDGQEGMSLHQFLASSFLFHSNQASYVRVRSHEQLTNSIASKAKSMSLNRSERDFFVSNNSKYFVFLLLLSCLNN